MRQLQIGCFKANIRVYYQVTGASRSPPKQKKGERRYVVIGTGNVVIDV